MPERCTAALDDKVLFAQCMTRAGFADAMPPTVWDLASLKDVLEERAAADGVVDDDAPFTSEDRSTAIEEFLLDNFDDEGGGGGDSELRGSSHSTGGFFLKHRLGVKGNAVEFYARRAALLSRLRSIPPSSLKYFVCQREVAPPLLLEVGPGADYATHVNPRRIDSRDECLNSRE